MRRPLLTAALLSLTVPFTACPTAPPPLGAGDFQDTVTTDTHAEADTTAQCAPSCGGTLSAESWAESYGWRLDTSVVRDEGTFLIGGAGVSSAVMLGGSWSGGFELTVTFTVIQPGGTNARVLVGAWADDPEAEQRDTVAAIVSLSDSPTAKASVTKDTGATDGGGQPVFGTASTADVAIPAGDEITLTLSATCAEVTLAIDGGDTVTKALGSSIPDVDSLFLQTTGGAAIRVTSVSLTNSACEEGETACSEATCLDGVPMDCQSKRCTPLGRCAILPRRVGEACTLDDAACYQDSAGTCDGGETCVTDEVKCDDGDPCTEDVCGSGGCQHDLVEADTTGLDTSALATAVGVTPTQGANDNDDALFFASGVTAQLDNPGTGNGPIAVTAWIKPSALPEAGQRATFVSQPLLAGGRWFCALDSAGHVVLGAGDVQVTSAATLPSRRWSHVACTYAAAADELRVFVDGALSGAQDAAGRFSASTTAASKLEFGSATSPFTGALDEVRIWTSEVADLESVMEKKCVSAPCQLAFCVADFGCVRHAQASSGCTDDNDCTKDTCEPANGGCTNVAKGNGTECDDGDPCTEDDACQSGVCESALGPCPAVECKDRSCGSSGCVTTDVDCDDGDDCTLDACVSTADGGDGSCTNTYVANCFDDLDGWSTRLDVVLLEPASANGDGVMGPPGAGDPSDSSSWDREGEPVEIPLWRGLGHRASVVAYFRMETAGTDTSPMGESIIGIPDEIEDRVLGGPASGGNSTPQFAPGVFGDAWALVRPNGMQIGLGDAFTLMAWVKLDDSLPDTTFDIFGLGMMQPGSAADPSVMLGMSSGTTAVTAGTTTIPVDVGASWHHVAFSFDGENNTLSVYLDGALVASETTSALGASGQLIVGSELEGLTGANAPLIDDLVICDEVLNPDLVAAVADVGMPALDSVIPDGVATQDDFDDVRVYRSEPAVGPVEVDHEVVGRRPHSDSGDGIADLLGYWRFDGGSLAATVFEGDEVVPTASVAAVEGAFGDEDGAIDPSSAGILLSKPWSDGQPFTVELWLKTTAPGSCTGTTGGPVILQTINGAAGTGVGFAIRVCDGKVRFDHVDGDQQETIFGVRAVGDGAWHHVQVAFDGGAYSLAVDGILDGATTTAGAPDGSLNGATLLYALGDDAVSVGAVTPETAVDELLFHGRARSVGYAFGRAYPTVPALRFLAGTAGDLALPHYAVYLGNGSATGAPPGGGACDGLLDCAGWVAWWPFDATIDGGLMTPDVVGGHHLALDGATLTADALSGSGLSCDAASAPMTQDASPLSLGAWAIEAGVYNTGATAQSLLAQAAAGGATAYELALTATGQLAHGFDATQVMLPGVLNDTWTYLGGAYGGTPATLTAYNGGTGTMQSLEPTATAPEASGDLRVCTDELGAAHFSGRLDDLRVMSRPTTPAERLKYPRLIYRIETATP